MNEYLNLKNVLERTYFNRFLLFSGQQMNRNLSSGFLPELSVLDCEVNAPLPDCEGAVPLGFDCVHLLDTEA